MFKLSPAAASLCVLLSVWCARADEERKPAAPRDVYFYSVNLRNTMRWSSGTNNTHGINYTVEYMKYGDAVYVDGRQQEAWRAVQQCDGVTQMECDLTEQTSDLKEDYFARVRANGPTGSSEWAETRRFYLTSTILGPPQLKVAVVENKLQVNLSGPFRWRWRKTGKKQRSMLTLFPYMVYNISVYNNSSKSMQHIQQSEEFLKYGPLEYNSQYCVRAEAMSRSLDLTTMWSDWSCVSTTDDPFKSQLLLLTLGGFLPTAVCLFLLVAVGAFAYYYICGNKPKLPRSVKNIHHDETMEMRLQTFQTEKHFPSINLIIINNTNLNTGESKHAFLGSLHHAVDIPKGLALPALEGGYAAQDVQPGPKGHRSVLSDDYGLVHLDAGAQVRSCAGAGVNSYMVQTGMTEQAQERYEEEDEEEDEQGKEQMLATWDQDPVPLQLEFPLLSRFNFKTSDTTQTTETRPLLSHRPDLTSVVVKQASEETGDDDPLLKMEQLWDLQVQSIAE